jgi:hypothetical protein
MPCFRYGNNTRFCRPVLAPVPLVAAAVHILCRNLCGLTNYKVITLKTAR